MRGLRSLLRDDNITINAVAPAATITKLLPMDLAQPGIDAGLPVSSAEHVGRAVAYAATATESRRVAAYGKETEESIHAAGRWNGRCIFTLGERYAEVEQPLADLRAQWMGGDITHLTRLQQAASDFRAGVPGEEARTSQSGEQALL